MYSPSNKNYKMSYLFTTQKPYTQKFMRDTVRTVPTTLNWLNDWSAVNDVLNDITEVDEEGLKNDIVNIHDMGPSTFFFHKMQSFLWAKEKEEWTIAFHTGLQFDFVDMPFTNHPERYGFLVKPRDDFYVGAVYKRFRKHANAIIFENGEAYVTAASEAESYWIASAMNYILLQICSCSHVPILPELTMITATKEIEINEYFKTWSPPDVSRRQQPERKVKHDVHSYTYTK